MDTKIKWAVVVPAYNEALTIQKLIINILSFKPTKLIVINDCSSDETANLVKDLPVILLSNATNLGKAACLWRGFDQAIDDMDLVMTLDGDGQHDPNDIPKLLSKWQDNQNKIILGSRQRNKKNQPFSRYAANKIANFWVSWAAGYRISDSQTGFRIYPVELLKKINNLRDSGGFVFESEVIIEAAWQNYFSTHVPIKAIYPEERRLSHFKPFDDIFKITKMISTRLFSQYMKIDGLFCVIFNCKKEVS